MGLISLKCPNCAGSIELDEKKDFGFCMHCGQKVILSEKIPQLVKIDHSDSIRNWKKLAEVALESRNVDDLKKYVEKILEADSEYAEGWILNGCASSVEGNLDEAAIHWKTGISLTRTSDELKEYCTLIIDGLSYGMIKHAIDTFNGLDFLSIFSIVFKDTPKGVNGDTNDFFLYDLIDSLEPTLFENIDSSIFYKIYRMVFDVIILSLAVEYSCKRLLKNADEYRQLIIRCYKKAKSLKIVVPKIPGELYYEKATIVSGIEADANTVAMFTSQCRIYLSDISEEADEAIKKHWELADDFNMYELFFNSINEYREGETSIFGKSKKISGQKKMKYYLGKLTSANLDNSHQEDD